MPDAVGGTSTGRPTKLAALQARGREALERRAWGEAYAMLAAADGGFSLDPADLERLAIAAHLVGRDEESFDAWARAHRGFMGEGDSRRAARCAFWLAIFGLLIACDLARCSGWTARGRRLLERGQPDCPEQGYLLIPEALGAVLGGANAESAQADFERAAVIGERHQDADLTTMARLGRAQALLRLGHAKQGVALLDEAMAAITAGDVSPMATGIVYCGVLLACQWIFDLRRAQEWTQALTEWCSAQADLVPYRGQCLVHRAQLLQLHGAWADALAETRQACAVLSRLGHRPWVGEAFYQQAELHRLRGAFAQAEKAYREASQWGRDPQPGLAQLRLAQGQGAAAAAAIRRATDEAHDSALRARLIGPYVEIMIANGDLPEAKAGAEELASIADNVDAPYLRAAAAQASGAVLLHADEARSALAALRRAWVTWQELGAPYEAARVRVLVGLACRALGDWDGEALELEAAQHAFDTLGATIDLARVDALIRGAAVKTVGGLTAREVEVLRLVAAGQTNGEIATALGISGHTVRRHLQNVFARLGVPSRAAAAAFVAQHGLT